LWHRVRQIIDLSPGQRKRYLGQLQLLARTPVRGSLILAGPITVIGEAQLRTWLIEWDRSLKTKANYHGPDRGRDLSHRRTRQHRSDRIQPLLNLDKTTSAIPASPSHGAQERRPQNQPNHGQALTISCHQTDKHQPRQDTQCRPRCRENFPYSFKSRLRRPGGACACFAASRCSCVPDGECQPT
jgi:hypothetical protein